MSVPFRIEKKEAFRVIGYRIKTTNKRRAGTKAIPQHWEAIQKSQRDKELLAFAKQDHLLGINIYNTDTSDARNFEYFIGVQCDAVRFDGCSEYIVPANVWAVFPCTKETIGKTEAQAITKWLPKAGYKPLNKGYITGRMKSGAPDIECYGSDEQTEVWIAVRDKE